MANMLLHNHCLALDYDVSICAKGVCRSLSEHCSHALSYKVFLKGLFCTDTIFCLLINWHFFPVHPSKFLHHESFPSTLFVSNILSVAGKMQNFTAVQLFIFNNAVLILLFSAVNLKERKREKSHSLETNLKILLFLKTKQNRNVNASCITVNLFVPSKVRKEDQINQSINKNPKGLPPWIYSLITSHLYLPVYSPTQHGLLLRLFSSSVDIRQLNSMGFQGLL